MKKAHPLSKFRLLKPYLVVREEKLDEVDGLDRLFISLTHIETK